ncbi:HNH endonuclease domain-containing protein [Scytonema sp. NUACC21]
MVAKLSNLPHSDDLDVVTLSRLFDKTTNSYKFIFFLSLLEILFKRQFQVASPIELREIAIEMLAIAWYPSVVFKLSFGLQDAIAKKLESLNLDVDNRFLELTKNDKTFLREEINKQYVNDDLTRYVPFRLLRPFFKEIRGVKDQEVNKQLKIFASFFFETRKPLYCFAKDDLSIIFHPEWALYIKKNYRIILAWVCWKWLEYMQKHNSNVPSLANKLFPPQGSRQQMQSQTSYWKLVIQNCEELKCIYSDQPLLVNNFSLDHYLPWTFVAHNQLWNLVPTKREINSSKSNKLPADIYFEKFVKIQHLGLMTSYRKMQPKIWNKYIECYITDLKFPNKNELLSFEKLEKGYELQMKPLIALAVSQGFGNDWLYHQT